MYPHLSLTLCCAQRMFIQALSSQLLWTGPSTNHTQLEAKQLLLNQARERDRKECGCGRVCVLWEFGVMYVGLKKKKTEWKI